MKDITEIKNIARCERLTRARTRSMRLISLFSGAGVFDLGFKMAGFTMDCVEASEDRRAVPNQADGYTYADY